MTTFKLTHYYQQLGDILCTGADDILTGNAAHEVQFPPCSIYA
jgi:hypothetical protein